MQNGVELTHRLQAVDRSAREQFFSVSIAILMDL